MCQHFDVDNFVSRCHTTVLVAWGIFIIMITQLTELSAYLERAAALSDEEIASFPDIEPGTTPSDMYRTVLREASRILLTDTVIMYEASLEQVLDSFLHRFNAAASEKRRRASTSTTTADKVDLNIEAATYDSEAQFVTRLLRDKTRLRKFLARDESERPTNAPDK